MITNEIAVARKKLNELKDDLVSKRNSLGYEATKLLMDNNGVVNLEVQGVFDTVKKIDTQIAAIDVVLDIEAFTTDQPTQGFNIRQPEQW